VHVYQEIGSEACCTHLPTSSAGAEARNASTNAPNDGSVVVVPSMSRSMPTKAAPPSARAADTASFAQLVPNSAALALLANTLSHAAPPSLAPPKEKKTVGLAPRDGEVFSASAGIAAALVESAHARFWFPEPFAGATHGVVGSLKLQEEEDAIADGE
jgi:hypothetical protein